MGGSTEAVEQAPERGASGRRRGGFRNGLKAVALLLLAQVIGIAIVLAFARDRYPIGPVDVEFHASLAAQGTTTVILPPLGQIDARTHSAPIRLSLLPVVFHARSLDALLGQLSDAQGSLPQVERDARSAVNQFGGRLLLLAFVGGCVGGAFTGTRRARRAFFSGLLCLAIVGGALGATAATYRTRAFTNPKFTGLLTEAPSLFSMLRRGFRQLPQAREQLGLAVRNLAEVYARLETASPSRFERGVRVLHASDLHNNPLGLDFLAALHNAYTIDLTIVTGDTTDYGTPLENALLRDWRRIPGPKLFIAGNHDSRATMDALRAVPDARVLVDGVPVQAAGLRIVGWNDPAAQRAGFGDPDPTAADLEQYRLGIEQWVARGEPADVLVLHHYAPAEGLAGKAPVVLFGHDHRARVEQREGSVLVDAGTTGAAGLRYLTSPTRPPFSAAVLQFSAGIAPRLEAVDLIHLRDPNGDFTVERTTVNGARARPGP